jgi:hypothetical protein
MSSRERRNSCGLSSCRTADVSAVATNMTLSKHEGQHQQSRRPCDHHSQQEPLVGFHGSVPPLPIWYNWNKSDAVPLEPPLSPKNETAGPHQFRRWTRVYVNHIYWPPPITSGERSLQYPGTNGSLVASDGKFQPGPKFSVPQLLRVVKASRSVWNFPCTAGYFRPRWL